MQKKVFRTRICLTVLIVVSAYAVPVYSGSFGGSAAGSGKTISASSSGSSGGSWGKVVMNQDSKKSGGSVSMKVVTPQEAASIIKNNDNVQVVYPGEATKQKLMQNPEVKKAVQDLMNNIGTVKTAITVRGYAVTLPSIPASLFQNAVQSGNVPAMPAQGQSVKVDGKYPITNNGKSGIGSSDYSFSLQASVNGVNDTWEFKDSTEAGAYKKACDFLVKNSNPSNVNFWPSSIDESFRPDTTTDYLVESGNIKGFKYDTYQAVLDGRAFPGTKYYWMQSSNHYAWETQAGVHYDSYEEMDSDIKQWSLIQPPV
ncbi:MAG: hypothetical protein PHE58_07510 [Candidatus Omnitrophica bacterium]|nr:hypothetical protein [Candidatus Omnitrophota bacterium]